MSEEKDKRTRGGRPSLKPEERLEKNVKTRLTEKEYLELEKLLKKSNLKTMAELARKVLTGGQFNIYHRSDSLDEVIEEIRLLKNEINHIGVNINQLVKRFHQSETSFTLQDIGGIISSQAKLEKKYAELQERFDKISDLWLQE